MRRNAKNPDEVMRIVRDGTEKTRIIAKKYNAASALGHEVGLLNSWKFSLTDNPKFSSFKSTDNPVNSQHAITSVGDMVRRSLPSQEGLDKRRRKSKKKGVHHDTWCDE